MQLKPKIRKAIERAAKLHEGQDRKTDDLPYIIHPFTVAWTVAQHTDDEDVVAAALLHDVLEDVAGYSADDMTREFGGRVTAIVRELSEDKDPAVEEDKRATWQDRKDKYLAGLEEDSSEALMICAADKLHNLNTLLDAVRADGDSVQARFNAPFDRQLWFYGEIVRILKERLGGPLVEMLEAEYSDAKGLLGGHSETEA